MRKKLIVFLVLIVAICWFLFKTSKSVNLLLISLAESLFGPLKSKLIISELQSFFNKNLTFLESKYGKIARILVKNGGGPPLFTKLRAIFPYFDAKKRDFY